jgi:hypothetical protein
MSLVEMTRVEKAIAFGGVAIGSMKAKEQAIVTDIIKAFGLIPSTMASSAIRVSRFSVYASKHLLMASSATRVSRFSVYASKHLLMASSATRVSRFSVCANKHLFTEYDMRVSEGKCFAGSSTARAKFVHTHLFMEADTHLFMEAGTHPFMEAGTHLFMGWMLTSANWEEHVACCEV